MRDGKFNPTGAELLVLEHVRLGKLMYFHRDGHKGLAHGLIRQGLIKVHCPGFGCGAPGHRYELTTTGREVFYG